jgi:hypothetical protein
LIKRYPGASDFFEAEKTYFTQPENLEFLFGLIETEKGAVPVDTFHLQDTIIKNRAAVSLDHINTLSGVMGEHYVLQIYSRPYSRISVWFTYKIGVALLLVPTFYTFWQVLSRVWQRINGDLVIGI